MHKYLGRAFKGDLLVRGHAAVEYRINCGWMKFKQLESSLMAKSVCLQLRLRLLDVVITPTILYSLDTVPLTAALNKRLDVTLRCMIRKLLGWVQYDAEDSWMIVVVKCNNDFLEP